MPIPSWEGLEACLMYMAWGRALCPPWSMVFHPSLAHSSNRHGTREKTLVQRLWHLPHSSCISYLALRNKLSRSSET